MDPHSYAMKAISDFGTALDHEGDGLVEELQATVMVMAGMILAMSPAPEIVGPETPSIEDTLAGMAKR